MADKRITIMIPSELDRKIRDRQAREIKKNMVSYSYSRAVCDILRKVL